MLVAILIMVTFLAVMQVVGMLGFSNVRARNAAAKRIAEELYELEKSPEQKA